MASDKKISSPSAGLGEGIQKIRALPGRTSGPTRRSTKGQWTPEEDEILQRAVHRFKGKNWKKIAECFKDRTDVQCLHRWQKVLNPELIKGPWSKEEDEIIVELVNKYGPKKWSTISQHLPGRIGKQCRERWHNHLNPSINKEAWTQEEEITLIRAHQMYGNKWAELTKFLPGRTDNSIKNHWNSSVKKKLDSYLKSGMLTQFQGLPLVGQQNQPVLSSSLKVHNGDDSGHKVTEVEDISECSQDSTNTGRFQSSNEMAIVLLHGEEPLSIELPGSGRELNSSPVTCSDPYYPTLDEPSLSLTDISHEIGFVTKFLQNFSHDAETSMGSDYPLDSHDMSNISSLEMRHDSLGIQHCIGSNDSHGGHNVQLQTSGELNTSSMEQMMHMGSDKAEHVLISDEECCRILFTEAMKDECFSARNLDLCDDAVPSVCQSSDIQISEANVAASQLHHPLNSDIAVPVCSQSFYSRLISADDDQIILADDTNHLFGGQEQEYASCSHDGFIYTNDSSNSPCGDGTDEMGMQEHLDTLKDQSKLVPVNSFSSRSDMLTCPTDARPSMDKVENGAGALCYEPPRFPSFDIPFFSCDLVQSGGEMQQEYSPLGIRQLMTSSMNCITPYRLWDSPTRGDSPDAVLKSAAKTFTGTPSILKKRHREFLSPLSDRRNGKKLEAGMTSRLIKDLSRLDVLVDEDRGAQKSSRSPSTNINRKSADTTEDKVNPATTVEDKEIQDRTSEEIREQKTVNADDNKTETEVDHTSLKHSGVLVEHNMNDLQFYSPKLLDSKVFGSSTITPRNRHLKSSCRKLCAPFTSPSVSRKTYEVHPTAEPSGQQHDSSSAVPEVNSGNAGADATAENCSVFGETPYKRSIESPSAWKSPWFINSFLAGPRVDTDITIEDIGYFMSPGDRGYDAIGLMKQISEQTAAAYANAQEVLGNETPQSLAKKQWNAQEQENTVPSNQLGNRANLNQNILTECRVLDFSECGTPGKDGTEHAKSSTAIGFSSPSSYLLKSCR